MEFDLHSLHGKSFLLLTETHSGNSYEHEVIPLPGKDQRCFLKTSNKEKPKRKQK